MPTEPTNLPLQTTVGRWPTGIPELEGESQAQEQLDAVLAMTGRLFPTALDITATLASDPEIPSDRHFVVDARVPMTDVPNFVQAVHRWSAEMSGIVPAPLTHLFRLVLSRVAA